MFENLVESSSHKEDLARKSGFFLGTMAIYAVLLLAAAIGSVYFYDAQLSNESLELTTLVAPVPIPPQVQEQPKEQPKEAPKPDQQVATRTELVARVDQPTVVPKTVETKASNVPPIPKGVIVTKGSSNTDVAPGAGIPGGVVGGSGGNTGPTKTEALDEPPPPPPPKPTPVPKNIVVSKGVLNGSAISLPKPPYPAIARAAHQSGTVTVQVTIDENGSVTSANAVSGPPLLRAAAVGAARQARFKPTLLSGQAVKASGVITYNFTEQ
ncbi:MAG: TonB family protein [Pyrinomonadaceae bacterium]